MDADLRIPVTAEQKRLVAAAAAHDESDVAGWVRSIVLRAARERMGGTQASAQASARTGLGTGSGTIPGPGTAGQPPRAERRVEWIEGAISLVDAGKKEQSLDLIFDRLDELLLASEFGECDEILSAIETDHFTNAQLLTALTATLAARADLRARAGFVAWVRETVRQRGADAAGMMSGLE